MSDIEVIASIAWIKLSPTKDFNVREKVRKALPFFTGMSVIASLPTVVGGVSSDEFLASVEVLDNSARSKTLCKKSNSRLKKK